MSSESDAHRPIVTFSADVWLRGASRPDQISVAVPVGLVGQVAKYSRAGTSSFVVILIVESWDDDRPTHRAEVHRTS